MSHYYNLKTREFVHMKKLLDQFEKFNSNHQVKISDGVYLPYMQILKESPKILDKEFREFCKVGQWMLTDIPDILFNVALHLGKLEQSIEDAPYEITGALKHISNDDVRRVKEQIAEVRKQLSLTVI